MKNPTPFGIFRTLNDLFDFCFRFVMMMTHYNIIQNILKHVTLEQDEIGHILKVVRPKKLPKNEFLLKKNDVCKFYSYVNSGCMRVYTIDENGFERITFFAPEDWWAVDLKSFIGQVPSRYFIDAMEDSEVLLIHKNDFDNLLEKIPQLEKWFRILLQNALIATENRVEYELTLKAEERYQKFLLKYPDLEQRIAQRQIASYLGITPEFLSMLRKRRR